MLRYAIVDGRCAYSGHSQLFVGGAEVGPVSRLAICQNAENETLLLHCDGDWEVLGYMKFGSSARAEKRAERIYPGVSSLWVDAVQERERSREQEAGTFLYCSFCGRRPEEVRQLVEGGSSKGTSSVAICDSCVRECYALIQGAPKIEAKS